MRSLLAVFVLIACSSKEPPADPSTPSVLADAPSTAGELGEGSAPVARTEGIVARQALGLEDLDCLAKDAGLRVAGDGEVEAALQRTLTLPQGATMVRRTYEDDARVAIHAYAYPLPGYTVPHLRDLQSDETERSAWAVARDRFVVVVDAGTRAQAQASAEALLQSACW